MPGLLICTHYVCEHVQFAGMKQHGTRIVLYNLWEDDQGQLELDFDADPYVCELVIDQFIVFNGFH
jgi:hypothetical protein